MNSICSVCRAENKSDSFRCLVCLSTLGSYSSVEPIQETNVASFSASPFQDYNLQDFPSFPQHPVLSEDFVGELISFWEQQEKKVQHQKNNTSPMSLQQTEWTAPIFSSSSTAQLEMDKLPQNTAILTIYHQRKPVMVFPLLKESILIGRKDPATHNFPDLDLTPFDPEFSISRKHLYLLKEEGDFFLLPISSAGTQINRNLLSIGNKTMLKEGDILVLAGKIAMHFSRL